MWQDKAACVNADPNLFLSGVTSRVQQAKAICETCPVIEECLAFAIANEDFEAHVYGGLTGAERRSVAIDLERQMASFA
jgi:WhiB family transcriptional regulator, redox-sensing transcriptional regulator